MPYVFIALFGLRPTIVGDEVERGVSNIFAGFFPGNEIYCPRSLSEPLVNRREQSSGICQMLQARNLNEYPTNPVSIIPAKTVALIETGRSIRQINFISRE